MLLVVVSVAVSIVAVVICIVAQRGILPANGLVGIRTPAVMAGSGAWIAGHRAGLHVMLPAAIGELIAAALVLAHVPPADPEIVGALMLAVLVVAIVLAAIVADVRARRVPVAGP